MVEYTLHSRTRRAMTCVYCEPKSRMTICSVMEIPKERLFAVRERFDEEKVGCAEIDSRRSVLVGSEQLPTSFLNFAFLLSESGEENNLTVLHHQRFTPRVNLSLQF